MQYNESVFDFDSGKMELEYLIFYLSLILTTYSNHYEV